MQSSRLQEKHYRVTDQRPHELGAALDPIFHTLERVKNPACLYPHYNPSPEKYECANQTIIPSDYQAGKSYATVYKQGTLTLCREVVKAITFAMKSPSRQPLPKESHILSIKPIHITRKQLSEPVVWKVFIIAAFVLTLVSSSLTITCYPLHGTGSSVATRNCSDLLFLR